jgi:hypothetical protein
LVKRSSEPPAREILGATRLGGNPGLVGKEESLSHGAGSPEPPGDPVDRNTGSVPVFRLVQRPGLKRDHS